MRVRGPAVASPAPAAVPLAPPTVNPGSAGEAAPKPRLLDLVRQTLRARHYSLRTEKAYVGWIKRFIFFHGTRHPNDMGASEVTQFPSSLATRGRVSASTQNQAFSALLFLYREVLDRALEGLSMPSAPSGPAGSPWSWHEMRSPRS